MTECSIWYPRACRAPCLFRPRPHPARPVQEIRAMHHLAYRCGRLFSLLAVAVSLAAIVLPAWAADDKAAEKALTEARQAFEQKNFQAALQRYRDFLAKFADHKDAPAARLGLALTLFEQPEPDFAGAAEQLQM